MSLTITANVVAWYAAIVATAALAVNVVSAWRDRAHLVVSARAGYRVTGSGHPYSPDKLYINVVVANMGRRPATVSSVWLTLKGRKTGGMLLSDGLLKGPHELKEGTATSYLVDQTELALDQVQYVYAADQTGRKWRGRLER